MKKTNLVKTEWDLSSLYKSMHDPKITKDVAAYERVVDVFAKKYSGKIKDLENPKKLAIAIKEYEKLSSMREGAAPGYYFSLLREIDARNDYAEKQLNLLSDRLTKAGNKLLFFPLGIGAFSKPVQQKILKARELSFARYYLERLFEDAQHHLSEKEEKILSLLAQPSYNMWVSGTEKMLNRKMVSWKGKPLPLAEAFERITELPKKDRRALWQKCVEVCKGLGEVAENEMNAVVTDKKIEDELRGFKKPYSATVFGYENDEKSIEALVETVTAHYPIAHRFFKLKAKLLGEKKLLYADRSARIGDDPKIPFEMSIETLKTSFQNLNPLYAGILDDMLTSGKIDVFPKVGKTGGAFCASSIEMPTVVLLNYVPSMRSLTTFAHEMGHAVHAERSKTQPTLYQGHSTATAETASTFFENVVFEHEMEKLSGKAKIIALHNKIQDDIASIMRQVAFFNFEKEMHETIRTQGAMNEKELAKCMQKHLQAYLGPAVEVTEDDGYTFVYVSHFRRFFYVYSYAYGNVISNALRERWKKDPSYIEAIDQFLTAGSSKSPEHIFRDIGIDTLHPSFFKEGMKALEERIDELEALI